MPNILWKNLYLCFSKLSTTTLPPPSPPHQDQLTTSALIENFNNSLYYLTTSGSNSNSLSDDFFSSPDDSNSDSPPDFAAILASQRFFFSSPGRSNSIIESPDLPWKSGTLVTGGIAVQTYSPEPYLDFQRSMQEMVEARQLLGLEADCDYMHELLLCYLTLNPKHTHKVIIRAFSDLLVSLMSSTTTQSRRKPERRQRSTV